MVKHILVAFDGSEPSYEAFDTAAEMVHHDKAELHVLTVVQVPEIGDDVETTAVIDRSEKYQRVLLRGLNFRAERYGVRPSVELVVGHVARQILQYAEKKQADLIVMGHRGRGALDRWRLGSVTHRIISYADCAVLVVRLKSSRSPPASGKMARQGRWHSSQIRTAERLMMPTRCVR